MTELCEFPVQDLDVPLPRVTWAYIIWLLSLPCISVILPQIRNNERVFLTFFFLEFIHLFVLVKFPKVQQLTSGNVAQIYGKA